MKIGTIILVIVGIIIGGLFTFNIIKERNTLSISQIAIKHFEEDTGIKLSPPPQGYVRGVSPTISQEFQGAVRPTDDELYFRKTGITRLLKSN